ncbi:MAG: hypothetical protein JXA20_08545 [Spirochaetes bacterium]|nr:hypothetical protein [Spirochaetota bacterium]
MKKPKRMPVPDLTEFTDEEGKKWKQTSTEDLFSMKELNTILETIEKERVTDEIILARIDFQRVNKEYYDAAVTLQKKLKKQGELLKQVIIDSRNKIERKNKKLKELIEYIKKLHLFIAYLNKNQDAIDTMRIPPEQLAVPTIRIEEEAVPEIESVYEEVEESELTFDE